MQSDTKWYSVSGIRYPKGGVVSLEYTRQKSAASADFKVYFALKNGNYTKLMQSGIKWYSMSGIQYPEGKVDSIQYASWISAASADFFVYFALKIAILYKLYAKLMQS